MKYIKENKDLSNMFNKIIPYKDLIWINNIKSSK